MKRLKIVGMVFILAILTIVSPIGHVDATPDVKVKVNGQLLSFPDQKPYIDENNRTMVPVRAPMEAIGCKVEWDEKARKAIISKDGKVAEFTIGSKTYVVSGTKKTMDTQAVIVGDRTAFPVRFAAEAMGATVGWDADTYTVTISAPTTTTPALKPISGVEVTVPLNKDYVTNIIIDDNASDKVENAGAILASMVNDPAVAEQVKAYIYEATKDDIRAGFAKGFTASNGKEIAAASPRGAKHIVITMYP